MARHAKPDLPDTAAPEAIDPAALYDALHLTALGVLAAEGGEIAKAETALLEASFAAAGLFPEGSREAEAFGIILAAAGRVSEETP